MTSQVKELTTSSTSSDTTKSIPKRSPSDQENSVRRKDGGYAYGPEVQQPVIPQPGSGKGKGDKEYGMTFDFNKQTGPEKKDASVREIKTARLLYSHRNDAMMVVFAICISNKGCSSGTNNPRVVASPNINGCSSGPNKLGPG